MRRRSGLPHLAAAPYQDIEETLFQVHSEIAFVKGLGDRLKPFPMFGDASGKPSGQCENLYMHHGEKSGFANGGLG
ncbi:hypothetical protein CVN76_03790 [Bacillus sp. mrc49]|nr:hypothetical protein CVN76_03790 [Bacillus sp. mrc49]